MDFEGLLNSLFRWAHIVAGITWIGLLYFFNWVNGPFAKTLDAESKKKVVPELLPRALFWFRWGAAWTWFTGLVLLALVFYHTTANTFESEPEGWTPLRIVMILVTFFSMHAYDIVVKKVNGGQAHFGLGLVWVLVFAFLLLEVAGFAWRGTMIHIGAMFGTYMAFNVWFRIWPAQKRIITATKNGESPDPADPALAGLRSKHNTYMSIPLVLMMINQHSTWGASYGWWMLGLVTAIGWVICYMLYQKAAKVPGF